MSDQNDTEQLTLTRAELRELVREEMLSGWKADGPLPDRPNSITPEQYEAMAFQAAQRAQMNIGAQMSRNEAMKGYDTSMQYYEGCDPSKADYTPITIWNLRQPRR